MGESRPLSKAERVALCGFAIAPVAFLPGALDRFVFPKVAMAAAAIALAALAPRRGRLPTGIVAVVACGALILLSSALVSASVAGAIVGRAPRYEGIFVLPVYAGAAAAGASLLGPERRRRAVPWWLMCMAIAASVVAIEALIEAFGVRPLASSVARPGSLLGNASDEGAYGVLCLGPFLSTAVRVRHRWSILGTVASAVVVVLSASRGALLGALAAGLVLVYFAATRRVRLVLVGGLAILGAFALAVPATRARILAQSPLATSTVTGRTLLWNESIGLITDHPALGVGPSGFLDSFPAEHSLRWQEQVGPANPADSPHDWVLQAGAAGGIPLALLAVFLALFVMGRGRRQLEGQPTSGETAVFQGIFAGLLGYGVALLFHLTSPGTTPIAAFAAGAAVAVAPRVSPVSLSARVSLVRMARVAVAGLFLVLCIVLVAAASAEIPLRSAIDDVANGNLAAASSEFALANGLRPWDGEIDADQAHAFAVAAEQAAAIGDSHTVSAAIVYGLSPAKSELSEYPRSILALEDLSSLEDFAGKHEAALTLVQRGLLLDPRNPQLLLSEGVIDGEERHYPAAAVALLEAARIDATSPAPWLDLANVYSAEGRPFAAAAAQRKAAQLGG